MTDSIFNGPSMTFTDQQATSISINTERVSPINELVELSRNVRFYPNMTEEYGIHIDTIAFTEAVSDYETEVKFKSSVGGASCYYLMDTSSASSFDEGSNNLDLGLNMYPGGVSASIVAIASRSKGFTADHLSKVWRMDPECI